MWLTKIGENAGKVWKTLHDKGGLNLSSLKKASKLDDRQLYLALGWLAREDKVNFKQEKTQILVSLK
jgi:hypothetical protein